MAELKERMSYPEFQKWRAFYAHEPLGERRLDLGIGLILKTLVAQSGKDVELDKFVPDYWQAPQVQESPTPSELAAKAREIFGRINATQSNR